MDGSQSIAATPVRTTCPYCGVGCGVLATPDGAGGAAISGDPYHPANFGRLCSKGSALGETLGLETRLLHPMVRDASGALVRGGWDDAIGRVADGFARTLSQHGPDAVAFYLSGQLLTEDYYVANKLMKGYLGSANVDTNSRLCMASSVAGHKRAFGADTVPGNYEDLDEADLIVLVGSNAAWCHPVLFQRMMAARASRGTKIVVIDPRRTATADDCDLFLPIAPGMDTALFCGLLAHLADKDMLDRSYIDAYTDGFDAALLRARQITPALAATAEATGLAEADVAAFFGLFASTARTVTCYSQGVNQSAQGTDKVNAIINCHLATGRIGRSGMGPFSLTGQPNAMGGREAGGLANQLAAHMGFSPPEIGRVRRFWKAPRMATHEGLKAVDMFEAVEAGRIKALWIMATNPAVSLPRADAMREALAKLDLLVVSENVHTNDTLHAAAHVLLPAAAWSEKDGTVTNSERRISRQRAFLPLAGEARPDWRIVSDVAAKMGFGAAFAYGSSADIFGEYVALTAFENEGSRDLDLGGLAGLDAVSFDNFAPVQWPIRADETQGQKRFFADGGFYTANRRGKFIAPEPPALKDDLSTEFPFRLNTGRIRDQWHTMTRTGLSPRLGAHLPAPFVEVHPGDAANAGLEHGGFARVTTAHGATVLQVVFAPGQLRGLLFAPIHWSRTNASHAPVGALVAPHTDLFSGQPESKATPASIAPVALSWRGFLLTRKPLPMEGSEWWVRAAIDGGAGYLFASKERPRHWAQLMAACCGAGETLSEYRDDGRGIYRAAIFRGTQLIACLFSGPEALVPGWEPAKAAFAERILSPYAMRALLSGRSPGGGADPGPLVCACFGVGLATISAFIADETLRSTDAVGKMLKAGTNCGSCLPEIRRLIRAQA